MASDTDPFHATGPGTPAGRYLRHHWQPVYHTADLPAERPVPLRIMGQDYVLYRGEGGRTRMLDARCPHRGMQLSAGWIEGECVRCFYHGWTFDETGQCVEQPAEDSEFAHKVQIGSYPTEEYLGLVFAWLGDGAPPALPRYPDFERFAGVVEIDSYRRDCNYFQNVENALDMSHVAFVHGGNRAAFREIGRGRDLSAEESAWGIRYTYTRADGQRRTQQFGMPNAFNLTALPTDPDIGWQESLFWWVPVDDHHHVQFSIHRVPVTGAAAERVHARRQKRRKTVDTDHNRVSRDVLAGRIGMEGVDTERVDMIRLQDDVAQLGQGVIADRGAERLGRGDVGVIMIRRLWRRELDAMEAGKPLKAWARTPDIAPEAWGLEGNTAVGPSSNGGNGADDLPMAPLIDVRPYVEIDSQLELLGGRVS
jgi:5,5'-dehydrodivanillate O-demethylase